MKNIIGFLAVIAGIAFAIAGFYNPQNNPYEVAFSLFIGMGVALGGSVLISGERWLYVAAALFTIGYVGPVMYSIITVTNFPPALMGFMLAAGMTASLVRSSFRKHSMPSG